jgi:hypothetical protein
MQPLAHRVISFTPSAFFSSFIIHALNNHTLSEAIEAMEDFNIPSAERVALLERLQEAMGGAPPYFWAACQICDLKALESLVEHARIYPAKARIVAGQTYTMVLHCK